MNSLLQTEKTISSIKDFFSIKLSENLQLTKVSTPLMVKGGAGINDDLNGIERPVSVYAKGAAEPFEIVQSLAKWKRARLFELEVAEGTGIVADMRAIRPDEVISSIHSYYVDQWDWEKRIDPKHRTIKYLKSTVQTIYDTIRLTVSYAATNYSTPELDMPEEIFFIHAEQLLLMFPSLTPKERENKIAEMYKAVFIIGIGGNLSNGKKHDGRAPDYDDWSSFNEEGHIGLNGDIIVWNPILNNAFELSSMGIRVNEHSLPAQLQLLGCSDRLYLHFHRHIMEKVYPQSIGGGIGQSRLCMFILQKKHIAEVQSSVWPAEVYEHLNEHELCAL